MAGYFSQAGVYLVELIFGLYILAIMLRFLLQWVRADFYNPISQALVKITNPPLVMLRRLIPGLWGVDIAAIVLMLVLQSLQIFIAGDLSNRIPGLMQGQLLQPLGILVFAVAALISLLLWILIITLFVRILLSWINPTGGHNPASSLLYGLTEPLMARARRIIPPMSGLDLSPIVVFVILQLGLMLLVQPLRHFGRGLL